MKPIKTLLVIFCVLATCAFPLPAFGLAGLLTLGTGLGLWIFFIRSANQAVALNRAN